MRRIAILVMSLLMLCGASVADTVAPASAHRGAATRIVIVRPVNASGHARPGFTITSPPELAGIPLDCSYPLASLAAVSPNIDWCSPSVAYPVACWKAAAAHKALCMQDPRTHELVRFPRRGPFASTARPSARQHAPLGIVLRDGDYCGIRAGGVWGSPPGHPHLVGYYACRHDGAVWASLSAAHNGIDESQPMWTVRTAHFDSSRVVTRAVARA
jgi:hypothetical protein